MKILPVILIFLPFLAAAACYLIRNHIIRHAIILISSGILMICALLLTTQVPFVFSLGSIFGINFREILKIADFLLLFIILYFGVRTRNVAILVLAAFQIVLLGYLEFFMPQPVVPSPDFYCDFLSLVMVLIICIVGSIICGYAIPYMKRHEEEQNTLVSRQPVFFFVMLLFLGAMNGAVLSNNMVFFYFFFELTTLCSFLLIRHDKTEKAVKNAARALWMNSLGGAFFIISTAALLSRTGTLDLQVIIHSSGETNLILMPIALLFIAAFIKSAQFPFQSWLLGAMVAPAPVSALLHSSTMVKVGVYLALRIAPAIKGVFLTQCVTIFGGFTFLAAAALAVGQTNGKKVLAYSTISNLGLIFACTGLNTPEALTAAIILIIFHAVSKALLFLCVGTIEQRIESRNIEDMRGLYTQMPMTALITVVGVIAMIMPPFGMLLGKWMAMEAAAGFLIGIIMIALGSALTVMYWARWAGILMSDPFAGKFKMERQPLLTWASLLSLCAGIGMFSILSPWIYRWLIVPALATDYTATYTADYGILRNAFGVFAVLPLAILAGVGFVISILAVNSARKSRIVMPYLSGLQTGEPRVFKGPMEQMVTAEARNYYLASIFGEDKLTAWINLGALVLITLLVGGTL